MNPNNYSQTNAAGFTLLEMIVSIGIFGFVLLSIIGIFQTVISTQQRAFAAQDVEESIRFAFEIMAKEIRTAERSFGDECSGFGLNDGQIYSSMLPQWLALQNQQDECVIYYPDEDANNISRLYITRVYPDGSSENFPITPNDISVDALTFDVYETGQPVVHIRMAVSAVDTSIGIDTMYLQTAVSSRYYLDDDID